MADYLRLESGDRLLLESGDALLLESSGAAPSGKLLLRLVVEGGGEMRPVKKGSTDQSVVVRIVDATDGTPETGVVFNTAGIDLWYRREGEAKASITEATLSALTDAHADGGFLHIGDGYYRLDLPDAAFAAGADGVAVGGAVTGMVVVGCYVPLVDYVEADTFARLGPPAGASHAADVAAVKAQTAAIEADTQDLQARLPAALTADGNIKADTLRVGGTLQTAGDLAGRLTAARAGYLDNLSAGPVATAAQITSLNVNTRANLSVPVEIETPDAGTQVYKVRLHLFDVEGNMEAPDSTPTVALTNAAGADRSSRLSAAANPSAGVYTWDYTATAGDAEEQLVWVFAVAEGGLTRTYPATSYVVEETAYRFSSTDRANLGTILSRTADIEADTQDLQGRLPAALVGGFMPAALGNTAHGGAAATLRLGGSSSTPALHVTNSGGDAVKFESTGGGGNAQTLVGHGTGAGLSMTGANGWLSTGTNGHGLWAVGGGNAGCGIFGQGSTGGAGACHGILGAAAGTGTNGGVSAGSGPGWTMGGDGTGLGLSVYGAANHGVEVTGIGASKHGVKVTGGTSGTSDGVNLTAGAGGVALRAPTVTVTTLTAGLAAGTITSASIADGAITDAKIALPAEAAGRPTGILGMIRRLFEWGSNKRTRSRATGALVLRNAADDGTLETQTQSSTGAAGSEVDTITKGV